MASTVLCTEQIIIKFPAVLFDQYCEMNIKSLEQKLNLSASDLVLKNVDEKTIKVAADMLLYLTFCPSSLGLYCFICIGLESRNYSTELHTRKYQDSEFFLDQLQTLKGRCIGPQRFQMLKNFSKISIPFWQV